VIPRTATLEYNNTADERAKLIIEYQ